MPLRFSRNKLFLTSVIISLTFIYGGACILMRGSLNGGALTPLNCCRWSGKWFQEEHLTALDYLFSFSVVVY